MEKQNPYQTPSPVQEEEAEPELPPQDDDAAIGLEFESDWSTEGIKLRRRNPMHAPADLGVAILTLLWICLFMLSPVSNRTAGLACLLTPIWLIAGGLWLTNLGFRNAGAFAKSCRGLCGPVRGRVEQGVVTIEGPAICLATRVDDCGQSNWTVGGGAVFRPPMITELLPILESDIRQTWESNSGPGEVNPSGLLKRLPGVSDTEGDGDQVFASGTLRGRDFRGQSIWRWWMLGGITFATLGLIGLALGVHSLANLPPWILNPPSHYVPGSSDRNAVGLLVLIFTLSSLSLVYGLYLWSRTRVSLGEFAAAITPGMLAIGSTQVALGYHSEALRHFAWTDRGVTVRNASGKVIFVLPARWFDLANQQKLKSWLGGWDPSQKSLANYYVGPKV